MSGCRRVSILVFVLSIVGLILISQPDVPDLDLAARPDPIFTTIAFEVGETYTLGSTGVPEEVARPVKITGVTVLRTAGVEVIGTGAFEPDPDGIGLVPGWPPSGVEVMSLLLPHEWSGHVAPVIGIRTTAPRSGLRGVEVRWLDARGMVGSRIFDLAVITCSPGACAEGQDPDAILRELGLLE